MTTNQGRDPSVHYCREVRLSYGPKRKTEAITGSAAAFDLARRIVDPGVDREHFGVICLDAKNTPLGWRVIAVGTVATCLVHPREVYRPALVLGASAIVVFHNHPSGDRTPSAEDLAVTERLVRVGDLVGVRLLDHLVLAGSRFHSFADAGQLLPGTSLDATSAER